MKAIYLDIFSGISGDLFLGALLDLGVDFGELQRELGKLNLAGYHLHTDRRKKQGIEGTKFDVHLESEHHHHHHGHSHAAPAHPEGHAHGRTHAEIRQMIQTAALSDWVKEKSLAVFARLAQAEGKIHGQPVDQVHFHEVGAVDSIVDIVGGCLALEWLGRPLVLAGPVVEGTGWIECAHGRFPIPAPATLEILSARSVVVNQTTETSEMVTPTGAAILAELAVSFGPMRDFTPERVGYGIGTRDHQTRPNVLRAVLGEFHGSVRTADTLAATAPRDWETDEVVSLQTNLDDASSEVLGAFMERALAEGALDVFFSPIQMKKNRPGVLLTVLCDNSRADQMCELVLRETSAFGVRRWGTERRKLHRETIMVATPFGDVAVKLGRLNGEVVQATPEFSSCKQVADQARVPLKQVYEAAVRATKWD